jgi:hypothetical protein
MLIVFTVDAFSTHRQLSGMAGIDCFRCDLSCNLYHPPPCVSPGLSQFPNAYICSMTGEMWYSNRPNRNIYSLNANLTYLHIQFSFFINPSLINNRSSLFNYSFNQQAQPSSTKAARFSIYTLN